jgi:hypothetical protein
LFSNLGAGACASAAAGSVAAATMTAGTISLFMTSSLCVTLQMMLQWIFADL